MIKNDAENTKSNYKEVSLLEPRAPLYDQRNIPLFQKPAALITIGIVVQLLFCPPCWAGCLCNLVALYADLVAGVIALAFLVGCISILVLGKRTAAAALAGASALSFALIFALYDADTKGVLGGGIPGVMLNSQRDLDAHFTVLFSIVVFATAAFIVAYFLPAIVAYKRNKKNKEQVLTRNAWLGFLPWIWIDLLVQAFADEQW